MHWSLVFFFNDTATTEIYTLSLHDALPIWTSVGMPAIAEQMLHCRPAARHVDREEPSFACPGPTGINGAFLRELGERDRKSTRLNSSHSQISYAVFCLKKKPDTVRTQLL